MHCSSSRDFEGTYISLQAFLLQVAPEEISRDRSSESGSNDGGAVADVGIIALAAEVALGAKG